MKKPIVTREGERIRLKEIDPDDDAGLGTKAKALARLAEDVERLRRLQHLLYADNRHALLVVLQAMDTGGKDGTIRHVMSGFNPAGCAVTSFKVPTPEEREHDFLWRIHRAVPPRGVVGVFNRSHYEDVLVPRVHNLVPKKTWERRYREINGFERTLRENGVEILKFYLHISKSEQLKRLRERIEDETKNWKFSEADVAERRLWSEYQAAYEDAINECTTPWAPWHIVPANKKWARDCVVARAMVDRLETLDLRYPRPKADLRLLVIR
jgi:PPK2 family polyphosphate:nucleotide phosphotransferase